MILQQPEHWFFAALSTFVSFWLGSFTNGCSNNPNRNLIPKTRAQAASRADSVIFCFYSISDLQICFVPQTQVNTSLQCSIGTGYLVRKHPVIDLAQFRQPWRFPDSPTAYAGCFGTIAYWYDKEHRPHRCRLPLLLRHFLYLLVRESTRLEILFFQASQFQSYVPLAPPCAIQCFNTNSIWSGCRLISSTVRSR